MAPFFELSSYALLVLLLVALTGRLVLSFLPPGAPGGHALHDLPATWAASHALGAMVLGLALGAAARLGLAPAWVTAPLLLAFAARVATLPGGLEPRHDVPAERARAWTRAARAALVIALAVPWVRAARAPDHFGFVNAANLTAIAALVGFGLERARRAPLGRALVLLALCTVPHLQELAHTRTDDLLPALLCAAGCAGVVPWLRRADRRGAALAGLSFAGLLAWGWDGVPLAAAGLLGLVLFTPAPGRRRVAPIGFTAAGLVGVWSLLASPRVQAASSDGITASALPGVLRDLARAAVDWRNWHAAWPCVAIALVLGLARVLRVPPDLPPRSVAPPFRELGALVFVFVLALVGHVLLAGFDIASTSAERTLVFLGPCAALITGLVLVPAERP